MKRYEIADHSYMIGDENGDFVLYQDAMKEIERLKKRIRELEMPRGNFIEESLKK